MGDGDGARGGGVRFGNLGRSPHERSWLVNAFVAKSALGMTASVGLIERLTTERATRRIRGFLLCKQEPAL